MEWDVSIKFISWYVWKMDLNFLDYLWFSNDLIAKFPIDEHVFQQKRCVHELFIFNFHMMFIFKYNLLEIYVCYLCKFLYHMNIIQNWNSLMINFKAIKSRYDFFHYKKWKLYHFPFKFGMCITKMIRYLCMTNFFETNNKFWWTKMTSLLIWLANVARTLYMWSYFLCI